MKSLKVFKSSSSKSRKARKWCIEGLTKEEMVNIAIWAGYTSYPEEWVSKEADSFFDYLCDTFHLEIKTKLKDLNLKEITYVRIGK